LHVLVAADSSEVGMREEGTFHALAWAWWALAGVLCVQIAPNPAYVALVVGITVLVVEAHRREGPLGRTFELLVAVASVFVVVRIALSAVTTTGGGDVLVSLPSVTLPTLLGGFTVGGDVHATVVLHAAVEGFVIVGVIAVFGAFNSVVSHDEIVRSAPRAFHEIGLVVTVALAFVPSTAAAIRGVREADLARTGGEAVRRGRLLRTVVPVLETGMERAMHLAESMDARGFAHGGPDGDERRAGWLVVGALLALGAAFVALVGQARSVASALGVAGAVAIVVAVMTVSRADRRPRHRPSQLSRADLLLMGVVALAPVALTGLALFGEPSLRWRVAETMLPGFHPLVALALVPLAAPVTRTRRRASERTATPVASEAS
jgi:energy-coupling factor transport system permease protein